MAPRRQSIAECRNAGSRATRIRPESCNSMKDLHRQGDGQLWSGCRPQTGRALALGRGGRDIGGMRDGSGEPESRFKWRATDKPEADSERERYIASATARSMSDRTISLTSSSKLVRGTHPSFSFAFVASPMRRSTSVGL